MNYYKNILYRLNEGIKKMVDHQASEQMIGYLYQVRYALVLLLENENTDYQLSIEKFDDVAFDDDGVPKELIQLKHHIKMKGSLSDSSVDLWRTLKVWMDFVKNYPYSLYNTNFLLITTSSAPENSAASKLRKTDRNVQDAYDLLKNIADKNGNKTNKVAYTAFLKCKKNDMIEMLERIIVIDHAEKINDVEKRIKRLLRYTCPDKYEEFILERLEGWWFRKCIEALISDKPQFFTQKQIKSVILRFAQEYTETSLPIDDAILQISNIEEEDIDLEQRIFLEQLRLLKMRSSQLKIALEDYYRAYKQRSQWIRNELIYINELDNYERRLIDAWREAYEWMLDDLEELQLEDTNNIWEKDIIKAGKELYRLIINKDIRIRERCQEPFIMKGSYHILANSLKVGWHKDFYEKLQYLLKNLEGV